MIELNKVNIEIDGQTYQFYKMSFGFQRRLIELQTNISKLKGQLAKKYEIMPSEVETSTLVDDDDKLRMARESLAMQEVMATLFVNKKEAEILDNFSGDNIKELIEALK